jgi:hypothetical protein
MSTSTRNLSNIDGANVTNPDATNFSANGIEAYADDAAFEADHTPIAGSIYWNTTEKCLREYNGTAWQYDKTTLVTATDSTSTGSDQAITPAVAQVISFTSDTLVSINNIVPTLQKFLYLQNNQSSQAITLKNNTGGTAANRILTGNGLDFVIKTNQIVGLVYDTVNTRWKLMSKSLTSSLEPFADDAAYATAHAGLVAGDEYWNTTTLVVRFYDGTDWQNNKVLFSTENNTSATGANADVTPAKDQIIKVSNASLTSVRGIIPAIQKYIVLINGTGATITIRNQEATATAANRIITGTGVDLSLANDASLLLSYDGDASRWRVVGGSGSGGSSDPTVVNYFSDPGFENTANGAQPAQATLYNDGAVAIPVDGTGGVVTGVTFLASTTTPIRGTTSAILAKDAANRQGMGVSFPFVIAEVDKGFTSGVSFDMDTDTNYVAGDAVFYIYDVTNSVLITPRAVSIPKLDNYGKFFSDFGLTTGTSYRFILHIATTNASAWNLKLDTMVNSTTRVAVPGAFVGPWESTSAWALGGTTTPPTVQASTTYYRNTTKDGEWAIIRYEFKQPSAGSGAGSGDYLLPIPTGLNIDYSRVAVTTPTGFVSGEVGKGIFTSGATNYTASVHAINTGAYTDKLFVNYFNDTTALSTWSSASSPVTSAAQSFSCTVRVPISQWSGSGSNFGPGANVEYASNSNATNTATDTTSFASGSAGSLIPNGATGTTYSRTVRMQNAYQQGDDLKVQVDQSNGSWVDADARLGNFITQGANSYGILILPVVGSTDVSVQFRSGGYEPSNATFANAGSAWSGLSTWKWRVRKANPSAPVGQSRADSTQPGNVAPRKGQTALTVTGTPAGYATVRAVGIYYQDQDGNHRLKFNISSTNTSATLGGTTFTITGVLFKNISNYLQACSGMTAGNFSPGLQVYAIPNTNTIGVAHASTTTITGYQISGDVELESKPSWA